MLFNSFHFIAIFFPIVTFLYFILPLRARIVMLLLASCYFYAAFIPKYIVVLFFLIVIDYGAGIWIEKAKQNEKRRILIISLIANLGVLGIFKYFNFFNANVAALAQALHWNYGIQSLSLALPIGLSFHTFQSMAYTIEVYRGTQKAEKNILNYALYVLFYPQLVAGPIERPHNLLHQFRENHVFKIENIIEGGKLIIWGFFKKLFVADRLALYVSTVYGQKSLSESSAFAALIATYCFAFQIYCDFSGYSDIARGSAKVMGFRLMENFNHPYLASNIGDFWRRWHISLSTWFRDYLYIPLGGNRTTHLRKYLNILIVFILSGFWHGANWTFMIWGLLHGLYQIISLSTHDFRKTVIKNLPWVPTRLWQTIGIFTTFHLVVFAWIFFRAESLTHALGIIKVIFSAPMYIKAGLVEFQKNDLLRTCAIAVACLFIFEYSMQRISLARKWKVQLSYFYYASLIILIFVGASLNGQSFVYFQF